MSARRYPAAVSTTLISNWYNAALCVSGWRRGPGRGAPPKVNATGRGLVKTHRRGLTICGNRATVPVLRTQKTSAAAAPAHSPVAMPCLARTSANGSRWRRRPARRAATSPAAMPVPSASGNASTRATSYTLASHPKVIGGHLPTGGSAYMSSPAAAPAPAPTASATGLNGGRRAVTARIPATYAAMTSRKMISPAQTPASQARPECTAYSDRSTSALTSTKANTTA